MTCFIIILLYYSNVFYLAYKISVRLKLRSFATIGYFCWECNKQIVCVLYSIIFFLCVTHMNYKIMENNALLYVRNNYPWHWKSILPPHPKSLFHSSSFFLLFFLNFLPKYLSGFYVFCH